MPTRTRLQITGPCLAFVTSTVTNWEPVFNDNILAEVAFSTFRQGLINQKASCIAYVLMPSHLHAVIGVTDFPLIAKFMQSFKILSSKSVKSQLSTDELCRFTLHGRYQFWQPRYDEFVIVSERQFRTKIEYIHTNPVRAGLVATPEGWMYSSAREWSGQSGGIVPIDRDFSFQK